MKVVILEYRINSSAIRVKYIGSLSFLVSKFFLGRIKLHLPVSVTAQRLGVALHESLSFTIHVETSLINL